MGQTDSVQTQTVAIIEPTPNKEAEAEEDSQSVLELNGQGLEEVVVMGGEQVAPLAQEEENLSICDDDFATPEAVSPINLQETVDLFTSIKPVGVEPNSPASPMDETIAPVADFINGIQRCESPVETSDILNWAIGLHSGYHTTLSNCHWKNICPCIGELIELFEGTPAPRN